MSAIAPPPVREPVTDDAGPPPSPRRGRLRGRAGWFVALPLGFVLGLVASGLVYLTTLNANTPPALSFDDAPTLAIPPATGTTVEPAPADNPDDPDPDAAAPAVDEDDPTTDEAAAPAEEGVPEPTGTTAPSTPQDTNEEASAAPAEEPAPQASPLDGTWVVGGGTQAGYRVDYTAVGMSGTRVGRGTAVTGQFELEGSVVRSGAFAVDFREVYCDAGEQCDDHVREIMAVEQFPYEEFRLTQPIDMGSIPADGEQVVATAVGELTLRGVTNVVEFEVAARRNADRVEVLGSILINRDDYDIPDSDEPGFSIDKEGLIEFLLLFDHQG